METDRDDGYSTTPNDYIDHWMIAMLLGEIKRRLFRIDRPYKDLKREIWKQPLQDIRRLHPNPAIIFDVGGNVGQTATRFHTEFPDAKIHSFEPFPAAFQTLSNTARGLGTEAHPFALSDEIGTKTLYLSRLSVLNSLLPPAKERENFFDSRVLTVQTNTVDAFCQQHAIEQIDLLKIDVQGHELAVLKGAEGLLESRQINLIYCEINYLEFYQNQAAWWDIPQYLHRFGYQVHDLYNTVYGSDGHARWCDALFKRVR
ncbi:MAG: FkbM family methyltransferase [Anaerolineae bacterium]